MKTRESIENWINAKKLDGEFVKVRQAEPFSKLFIDERGILFDISDLEIISLPFSEETLKVFHESNKRYAEQQVEHQELMNKMLASMDANSIADHKAKIDEREYWRKLRGDIALEIIRKRGDKGHYDTASHYAAIAEMTKVLFNELYNQDQEFFKKKHND